MDMKQLSPTLIALPDDSDAVRKFLTITDRQVTFLIQKMKRNFRWRSSDPESFKARLDELKLQERKCLLWTDEASGLSVTYSGLWKDLHERFGWGYAGPERLDDSQVRAIPWAKIPPEMRYYQKDALDALVSAGHGAISLSTGSGKSLIILNLLKRFPVKTIVMTPSAAITDQLYREFSVSFGKKYVGKYGDGRKDIDKLFTIGVAQALTLVQPGTEEWEQLSKAQVFISDESHTTPAETFEKVCTGVASNAKARFFVSATQLRNDGCEMILKGITAPIVYRKEFKEFVAEGWLKKPIFKLFNVAAHGMNPSSDVKQETRRQLYNNPNVLKLAADIANKAVSLGNRQTVIIIEEFKQFMALKNYLGIDFEFVHGGASSQDVKDILPQEYWKCDIEQSVKRFNEGKTKLLIGTSAISTGVDLKPVGCLIYLQGGTSEIKVRQAIGRGTRIVPGLTDFWVVDFNVVGSDAMERHFQTRLEYYQDMTSEEIKVNG